MTKLALPFFAILLATASACVEKRVISSNSYTGLTPIATRVQEPPKPQAPPTDFSAPFKAMGRGIDKMFGSDDKGAQPAPVVDASGQTQKLPRGFTGQTPMHGKDGKTYRLTYQNGSLVGVEPLDAGKNPAKRPTPAAPGTPGAENTPPPAPAFRKPAPTDMDDE